MIVKNDKSDIQSYLVDAANIKGNCEKVYFPENVTEICEILKNANEDNAKVTISAGRTGLTGGSVPSEGLLLSTEKLNRIISIDLESKSAIVQPGVLLSDFQQEVESKNLFFPPDPTETNATLGGITSTNASGARTFKYGSTRNFVEEVEVVLPTGDLIFLKRNKERVNGFDAKISLESGVVNISIPSYNMPNVKHAAGYFCKENMDLIDLFIGSEGTLGIITKIKFKLISLPQNVLSMIVFFNSENDIFSFVHEMKRKSRDIKSKIDLREIEFFDENALNLLKEEFSNIPDKSKGAIWIEQEYSSNLEDEIIAEITDAIATNNGDEDSIWFAMNEKERKDLKHFRHSIPLKTNELLSSRNLEKVGTDTAVPDAKFNEFFYYTKSLIEKNNLDFVVYGHIGNSHLHFNMIPKNVEQFKLSRELYGEICSKSVQLGGTISAEHGIGKLKAKYLLEMFGEKNILQMAALKKSFDPNMILNIGNIFDKEFLEMV